MNYGRVQKIVAWAAVIMCFIFSFVSSTPFGALVRIVVISVIVAIVYFEIRGYKKGKTVKHPDPGESGAMKNRRQVSNSEKCETYVAESNKEQWKSLYENGFITREEYAEHFGKR